MILAGNSQGAAKQPFGECHKVTYPLFAVGVDFVDMLIMYMKQNEPCLDVGVVKCISSTNRIYVEEII